jgi:hypothetical protein
MGRHLVEKVYKKRAYGNLIEAFAISGCFLINFSVVVGGIIETALLFSPATGIPKIVVKLGVVVCFMIITAFVLEPERLKPLGSLCAIVYILIRKFTPLSSL